MIHKKSFSYETNKIKIHTEKNDNNQILLLLNHFVIKKITGQNRYKNQ